MMISPSRAGNAVHSAVRMSGAARVSVFCHENQLPNAPWYISAKASSGSAWATIAISSPNRAAEASTASSGTAMRS
jgi:hypothetical protein